MAKEYWIPLSNTQKVVDFGKWLNKKDPLSEFTSSYKIFGCLREEEISRIKPVSQ
jgi:hypothetical protein